MGFRRPRPVGEPGGGRYGHAGAGPRDRRSARRYRRAADERRALERPGPRLWPGRQPHPRLLQAAAGGEGSEEHTSELQSLMRISYAVFCLKKKTNTTTETEHTITRRLHRQSNNN